MEHISDKMKKKNCKIAPSWDSCLNAIYHIYTTSLHYILCIIFYALYSLHYIICIVFSALYYMHCILCIVFYALYPMHFFLSLCSMHGIQGYFNLPKLTVLVWYKFVYFKCTATKSTNLDKKLNWTSKYDKNDCTLKQLYWAAMNCK